jgi:superfamily II DNA or RNA helicase
MSYADFIARKLADSPTKGMEPGRIDRPLFPHQADLVRWALRLGRAAIFADTGLGKTLMELEWAAQVATMGRVLILAPLAVAQQTEREGARFGIEARYRRSDAKDQITIANYEMMDHFDPADFSGIVLDESSILKSHDGATRNALIERWAGVPMRLACTATPAPNDHTELGNHSEFLGIKTRAEMLAEYFVHDMETTQEWRLKGHAVGAFWRWLTTWGAIVRRPSDLGYPDAGYDLPPMVWHDHVIPADDGAAADAGMLFAPDARTLTDQRKVRRETADRRVAIASEIAASTDGPVVIWCELNDEGDAMTKAIPGAVQVAGADSIDTKTARLLGFADGTHRVLVTKPKVAGFGLNWQHCSTMVFLGASHSYEATYQAVRRCWRFGQTRPVNVHVIRSDREGAVAANYRRKEADAQRMAAETMSIVGDSIRAAVRGSSKEWNDYTPNIPMNVPAWLAKEAE